MEKDMLNDYIQGLKDNNLYYILENNFIDNSFQIRILGSIQDQNIISICKSSLVTDETKKIIMNDIYVKVLQREDERKYPKLLLRKKRKMNQNKEGV